MTAPATEPATTAPSTWRVPLILYPGLLLAALLLLAPNLFFARASERYVTQADNATHFPDWRTSLAACDRQQACSVAIWPASWYVNLRGNTEGPDKSAASQ